MFPDKILLDYHDMAKIFNVSRKYVFHLLSENIISLKIVGNKRCKIQVSIVEMARYLDAQVESVANEVEMSVQKAPINRKSGRPRKKLQEWQIFLMSVVLY